MTKALAKITDEADWARLTPKQLRFLTALAEVHDDKKACEIAGCSPDTLRNHWRPQTNFMLCYRQVYASLPDLLRERASRSATKAQDTIVELAQEAQSEKVRLDAAKAVLQQVDNPTLQRMVSPPTSPGTIYGAMFREMMLIMATAPEEKAESRSTAGVNVIEGEVREIEDSEDVSDSPDA